MPLPTISNNNMANEQTHAARMALAVLTLRSQKIFTVT